MPPMQSPKKRSAVKKRQAPSEETEGFAKQGNKTVTSERNDLVQFISSNKASVYVWGCLPFVLFLLWTSTTTMSSVFRARQHQQDIGNNENGPQLENLLSKVIEVGRKSLFYDKDLSFEIMDRTIKAKKPIAKGSLIMDIAREAQIWHTDALLDPFIRDHLFSAQHSASGDLVDHRAYLAVYLSMHSKKSTVNRKYSSYLDYLPTETDYATHPVLQTPEYLAQTFGKHSMTYNMIRQRQTEWESEYQAFVQKSSEFALMIPRVQDYLVARIHVASRSFTTGSTPKESDLGGTTSSTDLDLYLKALGYDYAKDGFVVMVPILDALDHHHQDYNLDYRYNPDSRSYSLVAARDIPQGEELLINYGSKVDQWLYANYGFVNTDGSGRSGASLAAFHTIHNAVAETESQNKEEQRKQMLPYFLYDDGYEHCVSEGTKYEKLLDFKRTKMSFLEMFVNQHDKWMVSLPPRTNQTSGAVGDSAGSTASTMIPSYAPSAMQALVDEDGMMGILSTCRLLALIPQDYNGRAKDIMGGLLNRHRYSGEKKAKFRMIPGASSLEYRARAWLKRLAMAKMEQYKSCPTTSSSSAEEAKVLATMLEEDQVPTQSASPGRPANHQKIESHLRLGELQTLELLIQYADEYLSVAQREDRQGEFHHIRNDPCPVSHWENLLLNKTVAR